jgi:hypothetical protein
MYGSVVLAVTRPFTLTGSLPKKFHLQNRVSVRKNTHKKKSSSKMSMGIFSDRPGQKS